MSQLRSRPILQKVQGFGYGYLPLPLTRPKATTAGKNVPTGSH